MSRETGIRRTTGQKVFGVINVILLTILSLSIILPFLNVIAVAFNSGKDTAMGGVYFWPRKPTLANFETVFRDKSIYTGYFITIARTVLGTILAVFLMALAAYGLKCKTTPGRKVFLMMITFTMLFSGGTIPTYMLLKSLHLINTFWVYILPNLYGAWNLIMMRSFIETIPEGLEEAARIDGCGFYRTFFQIILPLSKQVIAVVGLFVAVAHWNDWFAGAFYVTTPDLRPVQTILQRMLQNAMNLSKVDTSTAAGALQAMRKKELVTGDSLKMATVLVTTIPIMCVYPFIQKYFATGMMIGAIKG